MTAPQSADVLRAADTIETLNTHMGNGAGCHWGPEQLRREASALAEEEAEAAEKARVIDWLAREIHEAARQAVGFAVTSANDWAMSDETIQRHYQAIAASLIESGWEKDGGS